MASELDPRTADWTEAVALHRAGSIGDADLACAYVAGHVRRAAGHRWLQAARHVGSRTSELTSPWVRLVAERELYRVPRVVPEALVAWALGERPVDLLFHVPSARDILALQARGRRCVSLLDDGVPTAPHEDGLAFAIHDLCHLEKFMNPDHHTEQIGLFRLLDRAVAHPGWSALEADFDATWAVDRDYVLADMNGSAAFLFVALRSRLKLAVRRSVARRRGAASVPRGPLDEGEAQVFDEAFEGLLGLLEFPPDVRAAARAFSSRNDDAQAAARLLDHLRSIGAA